MIAAIRKALGSFWPQFHRQTPEHLNPYYTFTDYRQIWAMIIFILGATALLPLIVVTIIHYQLIEKSVDSEFVLRTERLASNARRAVTFFLEERLSALRFTVNEMGYEQLTDPEHLGQTLRNLKMGFGGLTDLSVIDHNGTQLAYAGPFNLEGKDYSRQQWFLMGKEHDAYASEIFLGYREVPHIIIAVKSTAPGGGFFILRATIETERLIQTLSSYETGEHVDIFLINRSGVLQTPSKYYGDKFENFPLRVPEYSPHTQAVTLQDNKDRPVIMGYAYISTQWADTPFILIVVKQKSGMMGIWRELRSNINGFVGFSIAVILIVITITSTFLVDKLYLADKAKAETMMLMEQNNQLASIGQLAAGVAHEINNPLALINETAGYVKDLFVIKEEYNEDPELIENIDAIIEAVERCGTITRQLLGFARKFDISVQEINLRDVVTDVLNFHKKESEYRNICVTVDIPDDIPNLVTDRGKLQQVMVNLVNNAFHAIDEGCCLDIRAAAPEPDMVEIVIADNGCGISEENMKKIFEPFFTTKAEGKGSGLGLYITYGLVRKLQGKMEVQSEENEGTRFTITLPTRIQKENLI